MAAHLAHNQKVEGSIPSPATTQYREELHISSSPSGRRSRLVVFRYCNLLKNMNKKLKEQEKLKLKDYHDRLANQIEKERKEYDDYGSSYYEELLYGCGGY